MEEVRLLILGGGPAGYLGAERAGKAGLKTLVIEKREFGGVQNDLRVLICDSNYNKPDDKVSL